MMKSSIHRRLAVIGAMAGLSLALAPVAQAQVQTIDPNSAIDGDLAAQPGTTPARARFGPAACIRAGGAGALSGPGPCSAGTTPYVAPSVSGQATPGNGQSWHEDDLIGAAEGVFGKGASGLAMMIRDILKKQGEPIGYITGREAGGAFVVGLRYGGTLHHKIEGTMPVYWTGPSIGFDAGANAGSTFVLVYNLYDTADLYHRFGAGEGQAYLVGGFNVSYLRRGNIVLIPVRMGVGLRLGVNAGYMKFTPKQSWMPF
jgi:hypothetical protein